MDTCRPCGCKGIRTCLLCEQKYGIQEKKIPLKNKKTYVYCPWCKKAWSGWEIDAYKEHPNHSGISIEYPGIFIELDFLSKNEEEEVIKTLESIPWDPSQSGRRKQNFGPKCNFKKKKLQLGEFCGFPLETKFIHDRFQNFPILHGYRTIEQCTLEYDPERGASIDPHIDDCWIWGERIVTVNLLSDSVLTMTPYIEERKRYNIADIEMYPPVLDRRGCILKNSESLEIIEERCVEEDVVVRIPMPNRSLLVLYGPARYKWEHCVLREDILSKRVCLAYREFTPPYLPGGIKADAGRTVLDKASQYFKVT